MKPKSVLPQNNIGEKATDKNAIWYYPKSKIEQDV